ncbi:hypothetical protein [Brachybacterium sp. FME24]|uniref:hypothetical protein n=1 Tax=Brachybacterium sp. FME24 TaxID=2742605 RepID=UPI001D009DB4|nr:hypothetical protein [Brachybacterium sp. FME24]
MSQKKHHGRSSREPDPATRQKWQRDRELVLSEYGTWRLTADEDAPAATEVQTLETLLRLKAEQQGSPEPGRWTEEQTTALLTEVVPRTVIQAREQAMDMVPTLGRFFTYLRETGRWDSEAMSPQTAPMMLDALEFATLEAADDPSRRSFSTNILGHGLTLGIDLEDDEELAGYMHWYNSLPDDERVELSDTGRLSAPTVPFDRDAAVSAAQADGHASTSWPWFLPDPEDDEGIALADLDVSQDPHAYTDNAFVRHAVEILEFLGEDEHRITGTGALGRKDVAFLLVQIGTPGPVRSMWDHPEIAGPWMTLLDGGWLESDGGRVRRETGPVPFVPTASNPEGFVEFGHAVLTAALFGKDARDAEDGGFRGMPDTIAALLAACGPSGLSLGAALTDDTAGPQIPLDPATGEWDRDEVTRLFTVQHDLTDLADIGVLERDGERYRGSSAVMVALIALIKDQGSRGAARP